MRVARIIAPHQHGINLDELKRQLYAAGFAVEVMAKGTSSATPADIQIDLQTVPVAEALDAAVRMAQDGADVFIAPGVVTVDVAPEPVSETVWHESPTREPAAPEPAIPAPQPSETVWHGSPTREPVAPETPTPQPAVLASQASDEEITADRDAELPANSDARAGVLERISAALSERQQRRAAAAEQRRQERERLEAEEQARRRRQALELQRRREEEERALAERERREREQMTREAVLRAQRARLIEENERRRAAELERTRRAQMPEPERLAAMQAQMSGPPSAPKAAEKPKPVVDAPPQPVVRQVARLDVRRPVRPVRGLPSPRQQQWQRATLLASLVALMAVVGFAIAVNLRPGPAMPATMLHNQVQQKVPFGPATIAPAKPATSAPLAAVQPARKPSPRPSAAKQKPAPPVPKRKPSAGRIADRDEVVVHHFQTTQRAQSEGGIRRYSDQE